MQQRINPSRSDLHHSTRNVGTLVTSFILDQALDACIKTIFPSPDFSLKNLNIIFLYCMQPFQKSISSGLAKNFTKTWTDVT